MAETVLDARALRKSFGAHLVLDDVDLAVEAGSIVGLLGPNGSGKSTLLNVLTGFLAADGGQVSLRGSSVGALPPSSIARLGLVRTFQLPRMPSRMSVREVLLAANRAQGGLFDALVGRPTDTARTDDLLEQLKLAPVADQPASAISGGQKKLLSIAAALANRPSVLCLDEPTAGVHPSLREHIVAMLKRANAGGVTLLIVEHDMGFVRNLCRRCVVLDRGKLIADCPPRELTEHPRVVEAYLGRKVARPVVEVPA
ncbi:ABC transporter ATP-binding protein [Ancylobacter sonchi]|uniref:ABC transporter ATP-binding protein n=1 Tax=Ancylobacter sonchi TaxID=1937790 RepID=UPI001BD5CED2|nr:ABC transporter ATP-binding protein [Ancylobacter sonchi]MBS7537082.1 ABC transporter ATP-binding protein [Ancylobacter sonchi]